MPPKWCMLVRLKEPQRVAGAEQDWTSSVEFGAPFDSKRHAQAGYQRIYEKVSHVWAAMCNDRTYGSRR